MGHLHEMSFAYNYQNAFCCKYLCNVSLCGRHSFWSAGKVSGGLGPLAPSPPPTFPVLEKECLPHRLCNVDLCHVRAILHIFTKGKILNTIACLITILVVVVDIIMKVSPIGLVNVTMESLFFWDWLEIISTETLWMSVTNLNRALMLQDVAPWYLHCINRANIPSIPSLSG